MMIKFKKLKDCAQMPTRGSEYAAGYDLYAATEWNIPIPPHETVRIGTGLSMEFPLCSFGAIFARSGIATKQGLRPANCVGVIDCDYRGEIIVPIHNDTDEIQIIPAGSRIAQLILLPFLEMEFKEVDELNDTERGDGGFWSTGT